MLFEALRTLLKIADDYLSFVMASGVKEED